MHKMKPYGAMAILTLCYLLAMSMVLQSHLLYGGHEAMLVKALAPILKDEPLELKGMFTLTPEGDETLSSLMTIDFRLDGYVNNEGRGEIDISYGQPNENSHLVIARLLQDKKQVWLVPTDEATSPIDLSDLFLEIEEGEKLEAFWSNTYDKLSIEQRQVQDPRHDQGYLKRQITNYHLDLLALLEEEQIEAIALALGFDAFDAMVLAVDFQVDKEGSLVATRLNLDTSILNMTGWITLSP